jgi:hypothetical protein
MSDLSLRQIGNNVLHKSGNLSARNDVLSIPNMASPSSLLANLRLLDGVYRFAPELRLYPDEPDERTEPSSVTWYLPRVKMGWHVDGGDDDDVLGRGGVNLNSLLSQEKEGQHSGEGHRKTNFYLEITGRDFQKEATKKGSLDSAECYVHFRPAPHNAEHTDIQYWFFYPYNDQGVGHEADWEHITVRVTAEFTIREIFFSRHHEEGVWLSVESPLDATFPGFYRRNEAGHPIVYSAKGSHASYEFAGTQDRPSPKPNDEMKDGGKVWLTWLDLRIVGEIDRPLSGQQWVQYTGLWGQRGEDFEPSSDGPPGPAFQGRWHDDNSVE